MNPIEYPTEGPDEVQIENVVVDDVIPERIVAEEDLMEDPDENELCYYHDIYKGSRKGFNCQYYVR